MLHALAALAMLAQAVPAQALPPAPALDAPANAPVSVNDRSPIGRAVLDAQMREYFAGEKREAWFWLGAGAAAAGASTALMAAPSDSAHGASYPLFDISVVQLGAALWLFWRTDDQVARLSTQLSEHPCAFFAEEPERMRRVTRGFRVYLPVEALTLVGGAAMAGLGATGHHDFVSGAGFGLVAQSVVMLIFDQFAAARAERYQRNLREAARANADACR